MIAAWLAKRRAAKVRADFDRGYDWAAGDLLRTNGTSDPVSKCDGYGYPPQAFERGVREACLDWAVASANQRTWHRKTRVRP